MPLGNRELPGSVLADVGSPGPFADTRGAAGACGGPALAASATRSFDIDSSGCTGIPGYSSAFSLDFTIIATPGAYQDAFLTVWPAGAMQPTVSTLALDGGQLRAGTGGSISVFVHAAARLIIDTNGCFTGGRVQQQRLRRDRRRHRPGLCRPPLRRRRSHHRRHVGDPGDHQQHGDRQLRDLGRSTGCDGQDLWREGDDLHADGTVDLTTAERVGWAQLRREREAAARQPRSAGFEDRRGRQPSHPDGSMDPRAPPPLPIRE